MSGDRPLQRKRQLVALELLALGFLSQDRDALRKAVLVHRDIRLPDIPQNLSSPYALQARELSLTEVLLVNTGLDIARCEIDFIENSDVIFTEAKILKLAETRGRKPYRRFRNLYKQNPVLSPHGE